MALSRVISETFNVEKISRPATLKSRSWVSHGHWKWSNSIDWL